MYRLLTKEARIKARFIPKNAHCVTLTEDRAVYVYPAAAPRVIVLCYRGTAAKPDLHQTCKDIDRAQELISGWLAGLAQSKALKAEWKAKQNAPHALKVGQIVNTSWGYDQTNVDFFVITRVTARRVWVRPIAKDFEAIGFMQERCWPKMPIEMTGPETMHVANAFGFSIDGHSVSVTDSDCYSSSYA